MNRSTLLKLGALGATLYLANKNKQANANHSTNQKNAPAVKAKQDDSKDSQDKQAAPTNAFSLGKQLASKFFGKSR